MAQKGFPGVNALMLRCNIFVFRKAQRDCADGVRVGFDGAKKTVKNKEIGNGEPPIFEKTCLVSMTYHLFNRRLTLCLTKRVPLCEMDITAVLQVLVRDGLLTQQNQRRWASYRVAGDSPQLADDFPPWEGNSPQSSPQLGPDSPNCHRTPPNWTDWLDCWLRFRPCDHSPSPRARTKNFRSINLKASFNCYATSAGCRPLNWRRW